LISLFFSTKISPFAHLAVVVDVGEVAVLGLIGAAEAEVERAVEDRVGLVGEEEGLVGGGAILRSGQVRAEDGGQHDAHLGQHGQGECEEVLG